MNRVHGRLLATFFSLGVLSCSSDPSVNQLPVREADLSIVPPGRYAGQYRVAVPFGKIVGQPEAVVEVDVADNRFTVISITNIPEKLVQDPGMGITNLVDKILSEQRLNVDAVGDYGGGDAQGMERRGKTSREGLPYARRPESLREAWSLESDSG